MGENTYESNLRQVYTLLKSLAADPAAPPCVVGNARKALAVIWQATNDLGLEFEQLYDVGV